MRKNFTITFLLALVGLLPLAGCNSSDDATQSPTGPAIAAAEASAGTAASAAPMADSAADLAAALLSQGTAPIGGVSAAVASCPATFELPNGVAGTCNESPAGTFNFAFTGTVDSHGQSVAVTGTMVATASGESYAIDFDANATWPNGSAVWSATGTVTPGAGGQLGTVSLIVDVTVNRAGRPQITGRFVITPTGLSITLSNGGLGVAIALNRETMTGTISVAGIVVANLSIEGGCALVDFIDPLTEDRTVCGE